MPLTRHQHSPSRALDALQPYFERVESRTHIRHLEADPDFNAIREDPRFKKMLAAAKERLGLHTSPNSACRTVLPLTSAFDPLRTLALPEDLFA
jgi:hypothetical protein